MQAEYSRSQRISDQIHRDLAELINSTMRDPRLGMVTVSGVDMSADLSKAKIYVTILDQDNDISLIKQSIKILNHASGFLRTQLSKKIYLRNIPCLHFQHDVSLAKANHLSALISTVKSTIDG